MTKLFKDAVAKDAKTLASISEKERKKVLKDIAEHVDIPSINMASISQNLSGSFKNRITPAP